MEKKLFICNFLLYLACLCLYLLYLNLGSLKNHRNIDVVYIDIYMFLGPASYDEMYENTVCCAAM